MSASRPGDAGRNAAPAEPGASGAGWLRRWFADGPLRRVFKNAGLLLSGQGLAGVFGLVAFALAARALGTERFGVLVLIHAFALVISSLFRFNGWYAVIRYGAVCVREQRRTDLQRLIQFTGLLDLGGAGLGALVAVAAAPLLGPWLGWPADAVAAGQLYGLIILFNAVDTPTGILRLFDRFGVVAALRLCSPLVRCVGAAIAYVSGADLGVFLIVWFLAEVVKSVLLWGYGLRELARRGYLTGFAPAIRGLVSPHPGIWRLVWSTNLNSTLGMVLGRVSTLVVGAVLGPVSAGLYNIAVQFAAVLDRPVEMLRRSIYPELARLGAAADGDAIRRLTVRSALLVGACALPLVIVLIAIAEPALRLTVGDAYVGASVVLGWLLARQAILAFGFPLGLVLVSLDRASTVLKINVLTSTLYVVLLTLALPLWGIAGAGFSAAVVAVVVTALNGIVVARILRGTKKVSGLFSWGGK